MADVFKRVCQFFDTISIDTNKNYAIIGHNGINKIIRAFLTKNDPINYLNINQQHNEIIRFSLIIKKEYIIQI